MVTQSLLLLIIFPRLCFLSPCPKYSPLLNHRYPSSSYNLVSWNSPAHHLCGPQSTFQVWNSQMEQAIQVLLVLLWYVTESYSLYWSIDLPSVHPKLPPQFLTINQLHWLSSVPLPCSGKAMWTSLNHTVFHNQGSADCTLTPAPVYQPGQSPSTRQIKGARLKNSSHIPHLSSLSPQGIF